MATYTFTWDEVDAGGAMGNVFLASESIDTGMYVYLDSTTGKIARAVNTNETAADVYGIVLSWPAADQPGPVITSGAITVQAGAFASAGLLLVLSSTAGKCMDFGDRASGDSETIVGWTTGTDSFMLDISATGQQKA